MKKMNELFVKCMNQLSETVRNEKGSQTLEWIGIAAVVVIAVGVISTAFSGDSSFGDSVLKKFKEFIEQIG